MTFLDLGVKTEARCATKVVDITLASNRREYNDTGQITGLEVGLFVSWLVA